MATIEEKQARIRQAIAPGFRNRLLARGHARSIIWHDGELPDDAPQFSASLSYDLLSYAYALISDGLEVLEHDAESQLARSAFMHAGWAIESAVIDGPVNEVRDFHRVIAGAAYHLAGYSARAFSLLTRQTGDANLTTSERCLTFLILRSLDDLENTISTFKLEDAGTDETLLDRLVQIFDGYDYDIERDVMDVALTDAFISSMALFLLAFERGEVEYIYEARERLVTGMQCCEELHFVPQWWCFRLAVYLIGDLWSSSLHENMPLAPPDAQCSDWKEMRLVFIASLYRRSRAEIELWPSQRAAARRALDLTDNMVISMPTGAGKTRIAELCILTCLASGQRVLFVTPLRALSAQTEAQLSRTFSPLGKTVSSLYGGIGADNVDQHLLRERNIIVATPEKLDFALRNEPSLLSDVGLIVLDEGHMIGLGEREVRYEAQIQRLLRRHDAANRRIVCLSAVLPTDDRVNDFVEWLTTDDENGLIQESWRPTRLQFGTIVWRRTHGRLDFSIEKEPSFVPRYVIQKYAPRGRRRNPFPCDQRELCLATAWKLVDEGHSVLIFCPLRKSVGSFADSIVRLHKGGLLNSVLSEDPQALGKALAIGAEWFSNDNSILYCLRLGIAVHHGALPTPFRREIERLLRDGILKVTISSPTLAQGLNLTASALIFHSIYRHGEKMKISEFRNVVGRAGRAFIDAEGIALFPMFERSDSRAQDWRSLIADTSGKEMESGLLLLVRYLIARMFKKHKPDSFAALHEYVINASNWKFPEIPGEKERDRRVAEGNWRKYVPTLDTAILSLTGEFDVPEEEIETLLDEVLQSSLWSRRLGRRGENEQKILQIGLAGRARCIWSRTTHLQRKAYFLSGVGLGTGEYLDGYSTRLNWLLVHINACILNKNDDEAIESLIEFAQIVFDCFPFQPDPFPEYWKDILSNWVRGDVISETGNDDPELLRFIEDGLVYRLTWAMEAVRVRGLVHNEAIDDGLTYVDAPLVGKHDFERRAACGSGTVVCPAS